MAVRYDKDFNREITRIVKNFNSKVMRLDGVERMLAPDTVRVSDLKKEYTRRADLKRRLRELQLFSQRGAEEEVNVGSWHTNRYNMMIQKRKETVAKRNLTMELKKIEASGKAGRMDYAINLKRRREFLDKPLSKLTPKQLESRLKVTDTESNKRAKGETLRSNIFRMLYKTAYTTNIDPGVVSKLISRLDKMSVADLVDAFQNSPALKNFHMKYQLMDMVGGTRGPDQAMEAFEMLADDIDNIITEFGS